MAEKIHYQGRPEFIPREVFRQWMNGGKLNKLMQIDGIGAASYANRAERQGRPIQKKGSLWRPIDLVARARASGHKIEPTKVNVLKNNIEELERRKAQLEKTVGGPAHSMDMHRLSMNLTNRILLTEKEIVQGSNAAPHLVGVYFLVKGKRVIYVGQSINILSRIAQHHQAKDFDRFAFVPCLRDELDVLESLYIHALRPQQNGCHRHDGSHQAPLSLPALLGIKRARKSAAVKKGD